MTEDNKDTTGKWSAPTSSYEDAQTIKKFVKGTSKNCPTPCAAV